MEAESLPRTSAEHVLNRLADAPVRSDPYPHCIVADALPDDLYRRAKAHWPAFETLSLLQFDAAPRRFQADLGNRSLSAMAPEDAAVWREVRDALFGPDTLVRMAPRFPALAAKMDRGKRPPVLNVRLIEDHSGHAMLPHTDMDATFLSMLLYMPDDDSQPHLGTALYRPRDPGFTVPLHRRVDRFPREDFELAGTAPFLPNHLLVYAPSDRSFHGVEPVGASCVRKFLLLFAVADTRGP